MPRFLKSRGTYISEKAKTALLNCFRHTAWIDGSGQDYYDALETALYEELYPKIKAVYSAGTHVVYTDDTLDSLKPYIVVKYYETSTDSGTVIPSASYTLSGTLAEGTSIITVIYQSMNTSVTIDNVVDFYNIHEWSLSNGLLQSHAGTIKTDSDHGAIIAEGADDRRTVGTNHGVLPYYGTITGDWLDIYPIPIPMKAKTCTLTIEPSKSLISRGFRVLSNGKYGGSKDWVTYTQGPLTITLPEMSEQHYLQVATQYESGSTTYPEEIQEFTVTFTD